MITTDSGTVALPGMASLVRPGFQLLQKSPLLLNQRNFVRGSFCLGLVEEVRLVLKKDGHPRGCNTEHISCVFVDVLLKVQDLFIARLLGESTGQLVRIVLESLPVPIGVLLFLGEKEWANLAKSSGSRP